MAESFGTYPRVAVGSGDQRIENPERFVVSNQQCFTPALDRHLTFDREDAANATAIRVHNGDDQAAEDNCSCPWRQAVACNLAPHFSTDARSLEFRGASLNPASCVVMTIDRKHRPRDHGST